MIDDIIIKGRKVWPDQNRGGLDFSTRQSAPLLKQHSVPFTVKRYFTDVDGLIQLKNTVPAALRTKYPFFLWGLFDFKGAYATGLRAMPVDPGTFYLMSYIEGAGTTCQQITGFSGLNTVRTKIRTGDIVHVFTDNLNAPNYFIWIVISSRNGNTGAVVMNTDTNQQDGKIGTLYADHFQYFADSTDIQWKQVVHFIRSSNIASFDDNQVVPYMFKNPDTQQQGFIRMECKFNIDQYQSIGTYYDFDTETIELNFVIKTA